MDPNNNEQTELLRNIWNEMKALGTNLGSRIDQTNDRLDQTNDRLDQMYVELSSRIDVTNLRLESVEGALRDLAGQQLELTQFVKKITARQDERLTELANRQDAEITDLKHRVNRIETRLADR
jgi:predicted  nucleic acid-binding Zn-ribbon protein